MIRINLLSIKRKKKAKPLPAFFISMVLITVVTVCALAYLYFYFNSNLQAAQERFDKNKSTMAELKNMIKDVDNYEKLKKTVEDRTKIIEQLRKNQNVPVMVLDEVSAKLPKGVWLNSLSISGDSGSLDGAGFTNADVVAYVENLKGSKILNEIYLQESRQAEIEQISLYQFKLTFKVAG